MAASAEYKEPIISIVIPVYNEGVGIKLLWKELLPELDKFEKNNTPVEVIFVDDGSTDDSLERLKAIAQSDGRVRVVELLFNSGQHAAVAAGLGEARGKAVITLDADLQNPPSEISKIAYKVLEGYDMVSGVRSGRKDTFFRRLAGRFSTWIVSLSTGIRLTDYGSMLRGYSRGVARAIAEAFQPGTYIPALAYVYSKKRVEIETAHSGRASGKSRYGLRGLIRLNLDIMTGFSVLPLRLSALAGASSALVGVMLGIYILIKRFIHGEVWAQYGVFTLFALAFFFMGMQLVALAVMGEYVGRIYNGARRRPMHVIKAVYGGEEAPGAPPESL